MVNFIFPSGEQIEPQTLVKNALLLNFHLVEPDLAQTDDGP